MAINFDLNDLLAFRAVAELANFRKAAESVHLSQPAFSRRIDKLEQALGVRLLERTTRRVTLTAVGGPARLAVLGGEPLDGPRFVWWNFVSSRKERIEQAKEDWQRNRFDQVVPGDTTEFIPLPEKR